MRKLLLGSLYSLSITNVYLFAQYERPSILEKQEASNFGQKLALFK